MNIHTASFFEYEEAQQLLPPAEAGIHERAP